MSQRSADLSRHSFVLLVKQRYETCNLEGSTKDDPLLISSIAGQSERDLASSGKKAITGRAREDGRVFVYAAAKVEKPAGGRPGTMYIHIVACAESEVAAYGRALENVYGGPSGVFRAAESFYAVEAGSLVPLRDLALAIDREASNLARTFAARNENPPSSAGFRETSTFRPASHHRSAGGDSTPPQKKRTLAYMTVIFLVGVVGCAFAVAAAVSPIVGVISLAVTCIVSLVMVSRLVVQIRQEFSESHRRVLALLEEQTQKIKTLSETIGNSQIDGAPNSTCDTHGSDPTTCVAQ